MNIFLPVSRVNFHLPVTTTEVKLWLRNIAHQLGSLWGHPVWNPPWWLCTTFDSLHRISVGHICCKPTLLGIAKLSTRGRWPCCCIFSGSLLISSCELIGSLCQACLMGACNIPCRDGMIDQINMYDPGHACQLKIDLQSLELYQLLNFYLLMVHDNGVNPQQMLLHAWCVFGDITWLSLLFGSARRQYCVMLYLQFIRTEAKLKI